MKKVIGKPIRLEKIFLFSLQFRLRSNLTVPPRGRHGLVGFNEKDFRFPSCSSNFYPAKIVE